MVNPPPALPSNEETHSDDDIFCEIEDYSEKVEKGDHV